MSLIIRLRQTIKTVGPGFIIAAIVLGPGSITTSSKIGGEYGYSLLWVIVLAAIAMSMYTIMATRYGISNKKSILQSISDRYGRWFSIIIGISCFLMAASFQFGNNLGIATSMKTLTGFSEYIWPLIITGIALVLIFKAKNLYKVLEKLMMLMVMLMIITFIINLAFAKPDITETAKGFIPVIPSGSFDEMAALVATTFCLHVCLYQAYLVQNKGWKLKDSRKGIRDSIIGISMLAGISIIIIITSAATLRPNGIMITNAADMAEQLRLLFGPFSKYIFSLGLFAAAFSSLTVNAVVGGHLLSDSLGLGRSMKERGPKIFTALVMIIGMLIAVFFKGNIAHALVLAQAASLFAVPAVGIGLFLLLNNKKVMGKLTNSVKSNVIAVFGLALILIMVYYKYHQLIDRIKSLLN